MIIRHWQEFAFSCDGILLGIVGQSIQAIDQAVGPCSGDGWILVGVSVGGGVHLLLSGFSQDDFACH